MCRTVLHYSIKSLQVGPHWPITLFTYALIIVPSVLFLVDVAARLHVGVVVVGSITFAAVIACFTMVRCILRYLALVFSFEDSISNTPTFTLLDCLL